MGADSEHEVKTILMSYFPEDLIIEPEEGLERQFSMWIDFGESMPLPELGENPHSYFSAYEILCWRYNRTGSFKTNGS